MEQIRVVAFSDTHGYHQGISLPDGDILVHAGDLTSHGTLESVFEFDAFLGEQPHRHKVVIAGNHDWIFEEQPKQARAALEHATYLFDESIDLMGLTFYGSPWQPEFMDWSFNLPRGEALAEKWAEIPEGVDVLITHGPPAGVLDETYGGENVGCAELRPRIEELSVPLHIFGHIHEAAGTKRLGDTLCVNACMPFGDGEPFVVDLQRIGAGWRASEVT